MNYLTDYITPENYPLIAAAAGLGFLLVSLLRVVMEIRRPTAGL